MIYNIVDGLSKLLCDPLPYLKTKKNDFITTYAKRGTTTVHYLKLICDRRGCKYRRVREIYSKKLFQSLKNQMCPRKWGKTKIRVFT